MADNWALSSQYPNRPRVSGDQAIVMAARLFHLYISDFSTVRELESYADRNFYMMGSLSNEQDGKCKEYILKISNHNDSTHDGLIEALCHTTLFLKTRGHECPTPNLSIYNTYYVMCKIPRKNVNSGLTKTETESTHGRDKCNSDSYKRGQNLIGGIEVYNGEEYCKEAYCLGAVQLLSFVSGKLLKQVPFTTELVYEVGRSLGRLDQVLKELDLPRLDRPGFLWDLSCVGHTVERFLGVVRENHNREIVREVCDCFRKEVIPRMYLLPKQVIHGDASDTNVIVDDQEKIRGFIDFGDITYNCRVFELAISLMYILNVDVGESSCDLIEMAGYAFAGYQSVNPLSEVEIDLLYLLTAARFCQSLVFGAFRYKYIDPHNDYLLETTKTGWRNLEAFWKTPKQEVLQRWLQINEQMSRAGGNV